LDLYSYLCFHDHTVILDIC